MKNSVFVLLLTVVQGSIIITLYLFSYKQFNVIGICKLGGGEYIFIDYPFYM